MEAPLVSVCIPCYNAAEYIVDTLQSVLDQTYQNIEIIICDDQSKDASLELIKAFVDLRITVYKNEVNLGCSGNYNRVLAYAKGKYTKLLCADDLLAPDCIIKQVAVFEKDKEEEIVLVTSAKKIIDSKGKILFTKKYPGKGMEDGKRAVRKSVRRGTNIFGEPGLPLLRTSVLKQTTGVIEDKYYTYCNDFDLWCKMLLFGHVYALPDTLFYFRIVKTSVTSSHMFKTAEIVSNFFTQLYESKHYGISKFDLMLGCYMTKVMAVGRNLCFKLSLSK